MSSRLTTVNLNCPSFVCELLAYPYASMGYIITETYLAAGCMGVPAALVGSSDLTRIYARRLYAYIYISVRFGHLKCYTCCIARPAHLRLLSSLLMPIWRPPLKSFPSAPCQFQLYCPPSPIHYGLVLLQQIKRTDNQKYKPTLITTKPLSMLTILYV